MKYKEFDEIKENEILKDSFYVFFAVLVLTPIMIFKYLFYYESFSTFSSAITYIACLGVLTLFLVIFLVQFLLLKKRTTGGTVKLCLYLLIACAETYALYTIIDIRQQDVKQETIMQLRESAENAASKLICVKPKNSIAHALANYDESGFTQRELLDVLYEDAYSNRNKYISNKLKKIVEKLDEFIAQQNYPAYMSDDDKESILNELKKIATEDTEIETSDKEYIQLLEDYTRAASVLDELKKRHKHCLYSGCQKAYYDYNIARTSAQLDGFEDFMRICKHENK